MKKTIVLAGLVIAVIFSACKKEETFQSPLISDYAPLQVGKYIVYRLDSLVYLSFGSRDTTVSYEVKYQVDSAITDNLGRPAFRVFRFIRKTAANAWAPDNSFTAINTGNSFEFIENNMRFTKLHLPISNGYSWKGNSYIDTYSLNSDVKYLDDWDYIYDSVNAPLSLGSISLDSTLKVSQRDEIVGNPDDPSSYSEKNFSVENYAKRIGLVYKRFFHSAYQPPTTSGNGYFESGSYGITLTMIDHN